MQRGQKGFAVRNLSPYRTLVAAAAAIPAAAFAHAGHDAGHDPVQGFMHPLGGLDHVLAMIAVGVIAVQLGGRALWAVPLSFVATMAIAGFAGIAGLMLPGLEAGIALSVIVLGAVISLRVRMPVIVAVSMVAVFAIFHGYSHGLRSGWAS
jgi:urease accessory protein